MKLLEKINHYASQLPDKEIADFHGELVINIAHDERSYGPSAFTSILFSDEVATDNNPKRLYLTVVNEAMEKDKEQVATEAFHYFQGILNEYFHEAIYVATRVEDITEDDLPF